MLKYSSINCSTQYVDLNKQIESELQNLFRKTPEVYAHVIFNFVSPASSLCTYDFILFIEIPYRKGNYFRNMSNIYLNNLIACVKFIHDDEVVAADSDNLYAHEGNFHYKEELDNEKKEFLRFIKANFTPLGLKHFDMNISNVLITKNSISYQGNSYLSVGLNLTNIVLGAMDNLSDDRKVNSIVLEGGCHVQEITSDRFSSFIRQFIDICVEHTKQGILTKQKIDKITDEKIRRIIEETNKHISQSLCVIKGKAGTGKTLSLLQIMYDQVSAKQDGSAHHCRLLTFNNLLVSDLKLTLKDIGSFTPYNASIETLHSFFFDVYRRSPLCVLHTDEQLIEKLIGILRMKVHMFNNLISQYLTNGKKLYNLKEVIEDNKNCIHSSHLKELVQYGNFLHKKIIDAKNINALGEEYVLYKENAIRNSNTSSSFLQSYNDILRQLFIIFKDPDKFYQETQISALYKKEMLKESDLFKEEQIASYNRYIKDEESKLSLKEASLDKSLEEITNKKLEEEEKILKEASDRYKISDKDIKVRFTDSLKKVLCKVRWSNLVLIDEGQDCMPYEKDLLIQLFGSNNIVVATGGGDQLIRSPQETDWSVSQGVRLNATLMEITPVSHRQKGNLVRFLNSFTKTNNLPIKPLVESKRMAHKGKVIIDCKASSIDFDYINTLYNTGKDLGCNNHENLMFLMPNQGYTSVKKTGYIDVYVDQYKTININDDSTSRQISVDFPVEYKIADGTIKNKKEFVKNAAANNTRVLLYESCRGLEAWNVICIDLDTFYDEKYNSMDASEWAAYNGGGLFADQTEVYKKRFALLWCYMAMTRGMDCIYIKLATPYSWFSSMLLECANGIDGVEIRK